MTDPLTPAGIAALAEHLEHADPAALSVSNEAVARLLAMLNDERARADDNAESLAIAMAEWNSEAGAAHRKSLDWQLKAGRFFHERNVAQTRLDLLQRQLGEPITQWTVGHRATDGIVDWGDPMSEGDARHYLADERERWHQDVVLGARIVGDWYDAEPGGVPEISDEEMAELAAKLDAAIADGTAELTILPPDCIGAGAVAEVDVCPDCKHWAASHYRGSETKQGCALCKCPLDAEAALGTQT